MIFGTQATLARLGDFADFLKSVAPNVLIIVSSSDTFGDDAAGLARLAEVKDHFDQKHILDRDRLETLILDADARLKEAVTSVHSGLLKIFSSHKLFQSIQRSITDAPAASPFMGKDGTATCGLVILGQQHDDPKKVLSNISFVDGADIVNSHAASAQQLQNIIVLHESFHMRKGHLWEDNKSDLESFVEETGADRFALTHAARLPGYEGAIEDYKISRQLAALHGGNPTHLTGLALEQLGEGASEDDHRAYFDAACGFVEKVRSGVAKRYENARVDLPSHLVELLAANHTFSLAEGLETVIRLQGEQKFTPLENDMAEQYISSVGKWGDPSNHSHLAARRTHTGAMGVTASEPAL